MITVRNVTSGKITEFTIRYGGTDQPPAVLVDGSKLIVESCIITGAYYSGIQVRYGGCDVLILSCILRENSQSGAFFLDGAQGTLRQNEIYGNGYRGIEIRSEADPIVSTNNIRDSKGYGIWVHDAGKGVIRNNTVITNGSREIETGCTVVLEGNVMFARVPPAVVSLDFPELVFVGYTVTGKIHFSDPNGARRVRGPGRCSLKLLP